MKPLTAGELRRQSALLDSDTPVVLILDKQLAQLIGRNKITLVRAYPDTTDENDKWNRTFKIEAAAVPPECEAVTEFKCFIPGS